MVRAWCVAHIGNNESQNQEIANHVRTDYEKRLTQLQNELRKLEVQRNEHQKQLREMSHYEKQYKLLTHDIAKMKKEKAFVWSSVQLFKNWVLF